MPAERHIPAEDEQRHEHVLQAFELLKALQTRKLTADQMAQRIGTTRRTSYRFIKTFHDAGFVVMRDGKEFYIEK